MVSDDSGSLNPFLWCRDCTGSVAVLFGYAVLGICCLGDQFTPHIDTIGDAFYFSVVTISTVGYGDFTPTSATARLFTVSTIILGIILISTSVGATLMPSLVRNIEQITLGRDRKVTRNNHYIIVGYSALSNNTYRELLNRDQHVTVILRHESDAKPGSGKAH